MNDYFFVINNIEKQARGTLLGEIVKTIGSTNVQKDAKLVFYCSYMLFFFITFLFLSILS